MSAFYTVLIIAIVAGFAAVILFVKSQRRKRAAEKAAARIPVKLPAVFNYGWQTPQGVAIASEVDIDESKRREVFAAIDNGISNQLAATAHLNWQNKRDHSNYQIYLIAPTAQNMDGSPALLIYGIQSAGTVIGVGNDGVKPSTIILPHQQAAEWLHLDYLMHSVWHESEHDAEWNNDQSVFYSFIGAGDIHPHFPPQIKSFVSRPKIRCGFGVK